MHGSPPTQRKELEVKLDLAPDSLRALKKIPRLRAQNGTPKRRAEVSVYFDTDDHTLHKKGLMLRVRRVGRRFIQTVNRTAIRHHLSGTNGKLRSRDGSRI